MSWGVIPYLVEELKDTDSMFEIGIQKAIESGAASNGDVVVITAGTPVGMSGTTNTVKVQTIGHMLVQGRSVGSGSLCADVLVIKSSEDFKSAEEMTDYILVAQSTSNALLPYMKKAVALVVEDSDPACHAVTVGLALDIPVVYACENATKILKTGLSASVDVDRGTIS